MIEVEGINAFGRVSHYERKGLYAPSEVLPHIRPETEPVEFDGDPVRMNSARYVLFNESLVCVRCGLVGTYFAKERSIYYNKHVNMYWPTSRLYHFNLYGIKNGREIMFTKDHIIPRSRGGTEDQSNFQTMCSPCNTRKKDRLPDEMNEEYAAWRERVERRDLEGRIEQARVFGKDAVDALLGKFDEAAE